jgi:hypothetical protein
MAMYEIQGGRGYPARPSPLPVRHLQAEWWGKKRVDLKSRKIFSRRGKNPIIKNYKILYSGVENGVSYKQNENNFLKIFLEMTTGCIKFQGCWAIY